MFTVVLCCWGIHVMAKHPCDKSIYIRNLYTLRQWLQRPIISWLKLPHFLCTHANNWNVLYLYSLLSLEFMMRSLDNGVSIYSSIILFNSMNIALNLRYDKCEPYRKPEQTRSVIQPSYNTTKEPLQSWSTNIRRDSRMILWTQITGKLVSPGKRALKNGFLRKCFIHMTSLAILCPL